MPCVPYTVYNGLVKRRGKGPTEKGSKMFDANGKLITVGCKVSNGFEDATTITAIDEYNGCCHGEIDKGGYIVDWTNMYPDVLEVVE